MVSVLVLNFNFGVVKFIPYIADTECNEYDVRLLPPANQTVQICLEGFWGTLCDKTWDFSDARVVCRQLGYDGCELLFAEVLVSVILFSSSLCSIHKKYFCISVFSTKTFLSLG